MKKIVPILFSLCGLLSITAVAQEATAAEKIEPSGTFFNIKFGEPISFPRCNPYKPAIETTEMCYTPTGNASLFGNKTVQDIKIYFPKDNLPEGFLTPWFNAQTYQEKIVSVQVSTKGITRQEKIFALLEQQLGKASSKIIVVSGNSAENYEAKYTPGSILADWDLANIEVVFLGEYRSSIKGLLKADMKMDVFDKLTEQQP